MIGALCLGHYKDAPEQVLPALSKLLADNYPDVRIRAATALYKIGPGRAEKAGALFIAFDCLRFNAPFGASSCARKLLNDLGKLPPGDSK